MEHVLMMNRRLRPACLGIALAAMAGMAIGQPVPATRLVSTTDAAAGSTITAFGPVFVDGVGRPGALLVLADAQRAVWYDGAVIFASGSVPSPVLSGGEVTIGIGNGGRFVYSPDADGADSLWTDQGLLLRAGEPAPGLPGLFVAFASRPSMLPDGRTLAVSGWRETPTGPTIGRILYRHTPGAATPWEVVLRSGGDPVGGIAPINAVGVGFQYDSSDDGSKLVIILLLDTGSTADDAVVWRNGVVMAREGQPVPGGVGGENWQNFSGVAINDGGDWLLAGDTSGPTATDAFIAWNGQILVREGSTYGGVTIPAGSAARSMSLNNRGEAVFSWNLGGGGGQALFFAPDASQLGDARLLLRTGSEIDFDADGVSDGTVVEIFHSFITTVGLSLADDDAVHVDVSYADGPVTRRSLVRLALNAVFADGFEGSAVPVSASATAP
jgi:hypothetical protein